MAFCAKCGAQVASGAAFCNKCGEPVSAPLESPVVHTRGESGVASSGISENVAGLLCYVLGWITGLIFFFIDKRPFVRFHAAQSIVVFGGLQIIYTILVRVFIANLWVGGVGALSIGGLLISLVDLLALVLWVLLMVKAYQHEKYRVPGVAGIVDTLASK
jgi:uncharacterized membrane protein